MNGQWSRSKCSGTHRHTSALALTFQFAPPMRTSLLGASLIRGTTMGVTMGVILLTLSPPCLAQGRVGQERAIAKAVFAYVVAEQRRAEAGSIGPSDMELDTRRLQWDEASDSVAASSTERLLDSWIRFDAHHPRAVIEDILQHAGAARTCESPLSDRVCRSKVDGAVIVAMSLPRLADPDLAHVRVVLFSEVQDFRFMSSLALYLVTLRRSAKGWGVVSEELLFQT